MSDYSIAIKIGARLEKSFNDAIRAAQSGLSSLGVTASEASREMAASGRLGAEAFRDAAAAGKACAAASKGVAASGKMGAASSRDMSAAGKGASSILKEMATAGKGTSASSKDIAAMAKRAAASLKEMATEGKKAAAASKDMASGGKEAVSLAKNMASGGKGVVSLSKGLGAAGEMGTAASKGMAMAGTAAAAAAAAIVAVGKAIVKIGEYSVQVGKDFESAMSDASATADASAADYEKMKQAAMEMGKTTSKTATESAQALKYMSLAGWDVNASVSALPSVLKMSEASGMELERTSDLVTDSMAALGVTVDELPGYLDVATKAQNKSNQSAEQLMEAYLGVGGTMKNLNVPIAESATALGVLANRGLKGSEAGTALSAIMVNLTTGTGQAGQMMQKLGVSAFDSQGKFIGLEATLQRLNEALKGYSEEEKNAALAAIGGKHHLDALNSLMAGLNTTNEEGVSEWAALTKELENCKGSLDAMRDTKLDNLEGDLAALESATQDAGIKIYEHLNAPLRDFAQFGAQEIRKASAAMEKDGFSGMAGAAGGAIARGLGMIVERLPEFLATAVSSIVSFVVGFATNLPASISAGVAKGAPRLLKAFRQLGVDLVKAVIKGILSLAGTPLKVLKSVFFGGGHKKEAQKAGAEAAKGYAKGADENAPAASLTLPAAPAIEEAKAAAAFPVGQEGTRPVGGLAGQAAEASNFAAAAPAIAEAGPVDAEAIRVEAEQTNAEIAMDAAQPATAAEPSAIAETAIAARSDAGFPVEASLAVEAMPPAGVDEDALSVPSHALRGAPAAVIQEAAEAAPMEAVQNEPAAVEAAPKTPVEAIQATVETLEIPTKSIQTTAETAGIPADAIQTAAEASAAPTEAVQTAAETSGVPVEAVQTAVETAGMEQVDVTMEAPIVAVDAPMEIETRVPGGSFALDGAVSDGAKSFAGLISPGTPPALDADARLTGNGAWSGEALQTGAFSVLKGLDGVRGATQAESGGPLPHELLTQSVQAISRKGDAPAPAVPVRETQESIRLQNAGNPETNAAAGAEPSHPEELPKTGVAQFLPMARNFLKAMARRLNPISTPTKMAQRAIDVRTLLDGEAAALARGLSPAGARFGAIRDFMDRMEMEMGATRAKPAENAPQSVPEAEPSAKGSKIVDALNGLLGGRPALQTPAPGRVPTFVYSPTIVIEGGGDVKNDAEKANRMGMREFEKLMTEWERKNKRTLFA